MTAGDRIAAYLERCRRRLAWTARTRVIATGSASVAVLTLALAAANAYLVPPEGWILAARTTLYVVVTATLIAVVLRRIGSRHAALRAERRIPAFDGRLATWFDANRRAEPPALLPQLAADALRIVERHPPARAVPSRLLALPLATLFAAAVLLAWLFEAAPQSWQLSAERLWLGELLDDTRPKIVVEPGDTVMPRGADVLLRARAEGFAAGVLRVHAAFAGSDRWEEVDMLPAADDEGDVHEFVLVAVTESVDYFVSASGLNSPRFRIEVADLPALTSLDVTLDFPAWTRRQPRRQDHGDVVGVEGTQVGVQVGANRPLLDAYLVVNGRSHELDDGAARFAIDAAGTWHVAVSHRGQEVRISDEFLIDLAADEPPEVEFAFPGRDRSATAIEEVALRFRARDDFGIETLTLRYAVNGGEWADAVGETTTDEREAASSHLLYLEDLAVGEEGRPIRPGDVVSFYADAADHRQSTRSALYFVDVRPFDKRYRETASSGGGGGDELELSARQRDIVSATWNLIRERDDGMRQGADLRDQMDVVAILQRTLKDQVDTLVARTEGRQLADSDEVAPFVAELGHAAAAMERAAALLAGHDLDHAISPEQEALQHLLTAEASLRDVNVSLARSAPGGDAVSRSLSELVDLELDPERNRYETPQTPSFGQGRDADASEWQRLTELARRQEELARRQERGEEQEIPFSRWRLERLRRELDALRERLAEDQSGAQETRLANASSGQRQGRESGELHTGSASADIDRVRAAIDRSLREDRIDAEAFRQGAEALRRGAEQIRQGDRDQLTAQVRQAERAANALVRDQQRILERLEALQEQLLQAGREDGDLAFGNFSLEADAATKRRMQGDLERIAADLAEVRQRLSLFSENGAVRQLDRALDELAESRVGERLAIAAEYFEYGRPLFMIGQEGRVEQALAQFRNRIGRVAERIEDANAAGRGPTIDDVQDLRRQLQRLGVGGEAEALGEIARAAGRLAAALEGPGALDLRELRQRYRGLGANAANREHLYRTMLAQLDRLELALGKTEGATVRAQRPRDDAYDDQAVARYFRQLSCGVDDDC